MKNIYLTSAIFIAVLSINSSSCPVPEWVKNQTSSNKEGLWLGQGSGPTIEAATSAAWSHVFSQLAMSNTTSIRSEIQNITRENGGVISQDFINKVQAEGRLDVIENDKDPNGLYRRPLFKVVRTEQSSNECDGLYRYYVLLCTPSSGCLCEQVIPSDGGAVARSIFVPGLGQGYKGHPGRGAVFASAFLLLGAGAVTTAVFSDQCNNKAAISKTDARRNYFIGWRDGMFYASIGFSVSTAVVYLWNIFDARKCKAEPKFR